MNRLLFSVFYFGALVPLGVLHRLLTRRTDERHIDRDATTYWRESAPYSNLHDSQ